jgi:hypothetical protein
MFQVDDILDEAKKIAGSCAEPKLFKWVSDAIQLIANKGTFDPYMGWVDLCVSGGNCVTLPREVETPIAINIGGRPALGRDQLFSFHQNGPGDCTQGCRWTWDDKGFSVLYRDLSAPSQVVARLQRDEDAGKELIVYGHDEKGYPVRQLRGGTLQDGWAVPTIAGGFSGVDAEAPTFSRITRIRKAETLGVVELRTVAGEVLGVYEPDETDPWYRRIKLGRNAPWVRLAYRKAHPNIKSRYERIPLRSRLGFLLALRAVKAYHETDLANGHAFEADAIRMETEAQEACDSPTMAPLQVIDIGNGIASKSDWDVQ